ncbi:STAS domain-containing protein [Streptomyces sp. NPDC086010]|uniref:STAS domain-containing protein n=1 Tax=Streptomyces sp. NPDC086010 TaxID=3365745 RepID=UPI0037D17380
MRAQGPGMRVIIRRIPGRRPHRVQGAGEVTHVAVLNIGGALLVSIPSHLDEEAVVSLQEELSAQIVDRAAHGVVIDITALDVVDTFVGRRLSTIASLAHILGARPVLVGMRPAVALTLVQLGVDLEGVAKAADLEAGLRALQESSAT